MAYDIARLEQALINADKAGDADAARVFAAEIRKMRGQQAQSQGNQSSLEWSDVPAKALSNIPRSAGEFAGNIWNAVSSPVETGKALTNVFVGGVQNVLPEWMQAASAEDQRKMASSVGKFFTDRYGSMEGLKQTIANDPVGLLADASTVLSGGGALAAKLPGMAGKIGGAVSTAGKAIDPLSLAMKAAKPVAKVGGNIAAHTIGGIGTHTGGQSIKSAAKAGYMGGQHADDFINNLRGNVPSEEVVSDAKRALSAIAKERGSAYRSGMTKVASDPTVLDFSLIEKAVRDSVKMGTFKGKSISRSTTGTLKNIMDIVDDWKTSNPAEFHTPEGLDALKKAIGDIRDSTEFSTPSRAVADNVYNAVKNQIVKQAPEYGKVMKGYEAATKQVRELEKGLSLGKKASTDTALRKLQSVMRNNANTNYGNRVKMAETLEKAGAGTLMDQLAGQSLSSWTPRGLGPLQAGTTAVAGFGLNPAIFAMLPFQSPRLMGEAAYYAGKAAKPAMAAGRVASRVAPSAFQAGRIEDILKEMQNQGLLE